MNRKRTIDWKLSRSDERELMLLIFSEPNGVDQDTWKKIEHKEGSHEYFRNP